MKVYAKFRIDIDKEDESIYTQKAVNLMQKLGCKAEKLYSSMERYTFTVDIKKAVYRELMKLKKLIRYFSTMKIRKKMTMNCWIS